MNKIVIDIADLQYQTIANVSFSFDKGKKAFENAHDYKVARDKYFRKAYTKLTSDFNKGIEEIVAQMNEALPGRTERSQRCRCKNK